MVLRFAALVLALGIGSGCKTRPLVSDDAGGGTGTFTGADGGGAADTRATEGRGASADTASTTDARRDLVALDTAEYLACTTDDDCVASDYWQSVSSPTDCYCTNCSLTVVNKATDMNFAAQWAQHCTAWTSPDVCRPISCPRSPVAACVGGFCRAGSYVIPTMCPLDPNSGCQNAIACHGLCCTPGEWCDDTIGCRCGYHRSCPLGQACGHMYPSAGNTGIGLCGDTCCFDCVPERPLKHVAQIAAHPRFARERLGVG